MINVFTNLFNKKDSPEIKSCNQKITYYKQKLKSNPENQVFKLKIKILRLIKKYYRRLEK